jgi:hypothetical protein
MFIDQEPNLHFPTDMPFSIEDNPSWQVPEKAYIKLL